MSVQPARSTQVDVPVAALPAVLAVIEAVRASAPSSADEPFAGRLALTVPETARALGLSDGTVRALLRRGDLSSISFGRASRITVRELTSFLDRRAGEAEIFARPIQRGRSARVHELGRL